MACFRAVSLYPVRIQPSTRSLLVTCRDALSRHVSRLSCWAEFVLLLFNCLKMKTSYTWIHTYMVLFKTRLRVIGLHVGHLSALTTPTSPFSAHPPTHPSTHHPPLDLCGSCSKARRRKACCLHGYAARSFGQGRAG